MSDQVISHLSIIIQIMTFYGFFVLFIGGIALAIYGGQTDNNEYVIYAVILVLVSLVALAINLHGQEKFKNSNLQEGKGA